jgi:signal transduction histidine kinase
MATIEAGRMALTPKMISTRSLLESAVEMTRDWARQQNLSVVIQCPDQVGSFEADEQRMRQVMFNLLSNAIQYTPKDGHITLTAERQGAWMMIAIQDDGIGIPEEDQKRIFEKFERANPEARQSGAGLGLALVRSFVELHGGRILVESQKDAGTKITCLLPLRVEQKQRAVG